jgi:hypothetical protein
MVMGNAYRILIGELERKEALGRLEDRWKDNVNTYLKGRGLKSCGSRTVQMAGSCFNGTESEGTKQDERFLDQLSDCEILHYYASWS